MKGVSVLFLHQPCDLATTCVVDDLHCVYLGVSKTLLHLWLDKSNSKDPFYIGKKVGMSYIFYEHVILHLALVSYIQEMYVIPGAFSLLAMTFVQTQQNLYLILTLSGFTM